MILNDGTEIYWDERSLLGLTEEQIEDKAASMIKKATKDQDSILLTIVVLEIGIPYRLVTKLIDDGRVYVIPDKTEEDIEIEKKLRQRYDEIKKKVFEMNEKNIREIKDKTENTKKIEKNKKKTEDGGMYYNK